MSSDRQVLAWLLALAAASPAAASTPELFGWLRASGGSIEAAPSFLDGGLGKLVDGSLPESARAAAVVGEARLGLDWEISTTWRLFVHGVARRDAAAESDSAGSGLLEAYVEWQRGFGEGHEVGVRAGQFFLPSSRENVDPLWSSPYTLTLSTMNSWIAEEIRPIGLDLSWRKTFANDHRLGLAATVFGGNDTSGTLLAWRGFSLHDRPTPTDRFVPLPPLRSLPAEFPLQTERGSKGFGKDLDGRPGYAGRALWTAPNRSAVAQATIFLNDGDRGIHGGEYAWDTDFRWLSLEVPVGSGLRLLGEWGTGVSRMGFATGGGRSRARVDIKFDTFYLLLTREFGPLRASLRYDDFRVEDRDATPGDDNNEEGSAWTLAILASFKERYRVGAEYLLLDSDRPAARTLGHGDLDAKSFRIELWVSF